VLRQGGRLAVEPSRAPTNERSARPPGIGERTEIKPRRIIVQRYVVGIDWAQTEHAVCVLDDQGKVRATFSVSHSREGLEQLVRRLTQIAPAQELAIAIERPSGLLVDRLIEAGHPVVPIHPNALKASRPRYRAAGGKSDPGDAFILADLLRTDGHRFRALRPASDEIRALRASVRGRDDLVAQRVALGNQLTALLESFWPGAAAIFADITSPIALDFLDRYPTPESTAYLGEKRLQRFLDRSAYCGRRSPQELLDRLHAVPTGRAGEAETEAKGALVRALVTILRSLGEQIRRLTSSIQGHVATLPLGRVLMSFPRAGQVNAAQILAELGDDPLRFSSPDHLAAEAGVAPITHASGKSRGVTFRWACNKRLRKALTTFADNSRHASPWAAHVYAKARARGCDHPHAIRILARAWLRVLWRAWSEGKLYDPSRHQAALQIKTAA
jgi:transposase